MTIWPMTERRRNIFIDNRLRITIFHGVIYFLAFLGYNWDSDLREALMDPFRAAVERRAAGTYCGTKYKVLADPLEKSIKNADL